MTIRQDDASKMGFGVSNGIQTIAGNQLIVDSQIALPDETWLVDSCSMEGIDQGGATSFANPVLSGIFLCPAGTATPSAVTTAGLQGGLVGQQLISLPTDGAGQMWGTGQSGSTFISTHVTKEFIVPPGCFIRAVWDAGAGALPTVGASLQLQFSYIRRKVCP